MIVGTGEDEAGVSFPQQQTATITITDSDKRAGLSFSLSSWTKPFLKLLYYVALRYFSSFALQVASVNITFFSNPKENKATLPDLIALPANRGRRINQISMWALGVEDPYRLIGLVLLNKRLSRVRLLNQNSGSGEE